MTDSATSIGIEHTFPNRSRSTVYPDGFRGGLIYAIPFLAKEMEDWPFSNARLAFTDDFKDILGEWKEDK